MTKRQFPEMEAASFISKHSVELLLPDGSSPGGVRPVGSGSLVTSDGRHFILTATHVWAALRRSEIIYYSATAERSHSASLHKYSLTPYSLDDNVKEAPKPFDGDPTLLELHAADYQNIGARLSFFLLEREDSGSLIDCATVGSPGALAQNDPNEANTLFMELRIIFVEELRKEGERDGLDFLKALPFQDPDSPIRDDRGLSGG